MNKNHGIQAQMNADLLDFKSETICGYLRPIKKIGKK